MSTTRHVVLVTYPDLQSLDLFGPLEVFARANKLAADARPAPYRVTIAASDPDAVSTSSGLSLGRPLDLDEVDDDVDTLMVVGGDGTDAAMRDERLLSWLAARSTGARRVSSVCSGAFILGEAGLLAQRRATTHWASCAELAARYPTTEVDPDAIFVRDGAVATSAGVTAGMDLALAFVEEDLGATTATEVARWLVLFMRRPGGQAQFSRQLEAQVTDRPQLRDLQAWIVENPDADLSVTRLAERVALSPRHLTRQFLRELDTTPGAFVESARIEAARRLLETTNHNLDEVARRCGFGVTDTFRRAFGRRLGVSPGDYRRRFHATVPA